MRHTWRQHVPRVRVEEEHDDEFTVYTAFFFLFQKGGRTKKKSKSSTQRKPRSLSGYRKGKQSPFGLIPRCHPPEKYIVIQNTNRYIHEDDFACIIDGLFEKARTRIDPSSVYLRVYQPS